MTAGLPRWWEDTKVALSGLLHLGQDGSHVHVGMAIMVGLLLVTRGRRPFAAWGAVWLAELINEALDLAGSSSEAALGASLHDMILTLLGPTLLLLVLRRRQV